MLPFTEFQNYIIPTYNFTFPPGSIPGVSECVSIYIIDDSIVGNTEHIIVGLDSEDPVMHIDKNYQFTDITITEDARDCKCCFKSSMGLYQVQNDGHISSWFPRYNLFSPPDIEVQMEYTSLNVSEENSTAILCAVMTAGAVERNVTVVLQTHSITGRG